MWLRIHCVYMALYHKYELINKMYLYGYLSHPAGNTYIAMTWLYNPYIQI